MKLVFTFLFISIWATNISASNQAIDCTRIKNGKFYYEEAPNFFIIIERNGAIQRQHRVYEKFYKEESVTWKNNCSYLLKTTEINDPLLGTQIGGETEVKIISVKNNYYEYVQKENGVWSEVKMIYFLKDLPSIVEKQKQFN
ncbi:hypothetical protein P3G55_08100 [Leptospira sp. 96542]|nr:hypothetical protein [Leptospira sp. 96542]